MSEIRVDSIALETIAIPFQHAALLLIKASHGVLGCGYLNCAVAEKTGDAVAIVTGVKSHADMLEAAVVQVSGAAARLGIAPGMTGREALRLMK